MALVDFEWVEVTDRKYTGYQYRIKMYDGSGKVDLYVQGQNSLINLKMSKEETEELIVRLQYALYTRENGE